MLLVARLVTSSESVEASPVLNEKMKVHHVNEEPSDDSSEDASSENFNLYSIMSKSKAKPY